MNAEVRWRSVIGAFAAYLAIAGVLWGPGLWAYPIYDDISILAHASPLGGVALGDLWTGTLSGFWRPVPLTICWLWLFAFGLEPFALHLPTILLHAVNGVLLGLLGRQFGMKPQGALLLGAAFVAHFACWTAVAAMQAIMDVLLATWVLAAAFVVPREWSARTVVAVLALQVLALLTKETSVVFPIAVAGVWIAKRSFAGDGVPSRRQWLALVPFAALAVAQVALVLMLQRTGEFTYSDQGGVTLSPVTFLRQFTDHAFSLAVPFVHVSEAPLVAIQLPGAVLWLVRIGVAALIGGGCWLAFGKRRPGALLVLAGLALLLPISPLEGRPQGRFLYPVLPLAMLGAVLLVGEAPVWGRRLGAVAAILFYIVTAPAFYLSPSTFRYRENAAEVGTFGEQFAAASSEWRDGDVILVEDHPHPGRSEWRQLYANGLARILVPDMRITVVTSDAEAADHAYRWIDRVLVSESP